MVVTWRLPVGWPYATYYRIMRNRPELGESEPLVYVRYTEDGGGTTYTDTGVEPGVLYVYRVKGVNFLGLTREASEPVEIRTPESTPVENSPATGAPTIGGTTQVGETLTVDVSGISDADGLSNVTYNYQWVSNDDNGDVDIAGATGSTYTLSDADVGRTIAVRVDFTDDRGNPETLTGASTETVTLLIWSASLTVATDGLQSGYSLSQGVGTLTPGGFFRRCRGLHRLVGCSETPTGR